ncbi:MAG: hypothetical protein NTZ05_14570 [Chloroflexi bacterium]|nr:hypothetical protein [Chloroflexota bacterium]
MVCCNENAVWALLWFMVWLKVIATVVLVPMPPAPLKGVSELTVGGPTVAKVRKVADEAAASAFPATSFAPIPIVMVYSVSCDRLADGVQVATVFCGAFQLQPQTTAGDAEKALWTVPVFIASLKVTTMVASRGTLVAVLAGLKLTKVGATVSTLRGASVEGAPMPPRRLTPRTR